MNAASQSKHNSGEGQSALPFVAGEWAKGRDTIQVAITEYNNRRCLDCRVWFTNDAGKLKPSSQGLTLQLDALPKRAKALKDAMSFAKVHGFLPEGGDQ